MFKVIVSLYISPEVAPRKNLSANSLFGRVAGGEVQLGQRERKAANKRSIITNVTPVDNWNSVPLGNSGARVKPSPRIHSNQESGEMWYLYTSQSLLKGCFQSCSFFGFSSRVCGGSRGGLVAREIRLAKPWNSWQLAVGPT